MPLFDSSRAAVPTIPPDPRLVVVTADGSAPSDLVRALGAAGVEIDVVRAVDGCWPRAASTSPGGLVLVLADAAVALARVGPPPGARVVVVTDTAPGPADFRAALALRAERLAELPIDVGWIVESASHPSPRGSGAVVVAVMGAQGGVGASCVAGALALQAPGGSVAALDLDPWGRGLSVALPSSGGEVGWEALAGLAGRLDGEALAGRLPRAVGGGPALVGFEEPGTVVSPPTASVLRAVEACGRAFAHVVLDVPRSDRDLMADLASQCHRVVLVLRADGPGLEAAARVRASLAIPRSGLVLAARRGAVPLSETADLLDAGGAVAIPEVRRLADRLDLAAGLPRRGRGARAALRLWAAITSPEAS